MSERTLTSGVSSAAAAWGVVERTQARASVVRAVLRRATPARTWKLTIDLGAGQAKLDAGGGASLALALAQGAAAQDAASWTCDCPAGALSVCLHAALAAQALTAQVDETPRGEPAPDPSWALEAHDAPSGLRAAAEKGTVSLDPGDDAIGAGDATVRKGATTGALTCDCPMRAHPWCIHRLSVDAWARGRRGTRAGASVGAMEGAASPIAAAPTAQRKRAGEKLPAEDVARFEPLLARAMEMVAELLTFGLQRSGPGTIERLDALVIAVRSLGVRDTAPRNAGLGRLVRGLERLRTTLGEFHQRLVTATELEVVRELSAIRNIVRAVRANTGALPLSDFAGATQQEYETVAALDLQGIGLEAWVTPAGFAGVTAFAVDLRSGRVVTRTNVLPADLAQEQAARSWSSRWADQLAAQPAFTGSTLSVHELAAGRFLVSGAQVAPDSGRLSSSGKTQVAKRPALPIDDPKLRPVRLEGAADAARLSAGLTFDPLARPAGSAPVALVPVLALSPPTFDRARQELRFGVAIPGSAVLPCRIGYRDDRALWLDQLERLMKAREAPKALLARLVLGPGGLGLEPLTAFRAKGAPIHLTYTALE